MNEKFSDFKSLEKLPLFIEELEKQMSNIDEEIGTLVSERASYNDEMKMYMTEFNNDDDVNKII